MPITQTNGIQCSQPLKPVSAQPIREAVSFKNNAPSQAAPQDSFQCLEAKYDFACRLIAVKNEDIAAARTEANYYRAKYENLCKNGACIA